MKRPFSITILALLVLLAAALGWSRLVQSIRLWDLIQNGQYSVHPGYLAATGVVFGLAGVPLFLGAWTGKRWARRGSQIFLAVWVLYYWLDRLVFGVSDTVKENTPFMLGLTAALLLWTSWIAGRPKVRRYFGANENLEN